MRRCSTCRVASDSSSAPTCRWRACTYAAHGCRPRRSATAPLRALRALERGDQPERADRARFAEPRARIAEGRWLAAHGATAMIDVSDGLAADLRHVAAASGVRLRVEDEHVPRVSGVSLTDA